MHTLNVCIAAVSRLPSVQVLHWSPILQNFFKPPNRSTKLILITPNKKNNCYYKKKYNI